MVPKISLVSSSTVTMLVVVLAACSSDDSAESTIAPLADEPELVWSACEASATLDCTTLKVPVDYSQPQSASMEIALARLAAPAATRKGAILLNPGGPGGSGVDLLFELTSETDDSVIPEIILNEYDIVGFDPRGVGGSQAVDCTAFGLDDLDAYPVTASAIQQLEAASVEYANACYEKYGDYLLQLGSNNVARDIDKIRASLGEEKLNFIGYSYGTRLAATYLQLFPGQVGALVMDAPLPPDPAVEPLSEATLATLQANLVGVFKDCSSSQDECDPDSVVSELTSRVDDLKTRGDEETFDLLSGLLLNSAQMPGFGQLASETLLEYAANGDSTVLELFSALFDDAFGEDSLADDDNETSLKAVMCADDAVRPVSSDLIPLLTSYNSVSDLFAEAYVANAGLCMGWPAAIDPVEILSTPVSSGLLIIGGTSDAQTPLVWSESIAAVTTSPLIVSGHSGHTVVFQDENECVDQQVVDFIREGRIPEQADCLEP